jgi:tetratricopeptide (TPR) repeat protein
MNRQRHAQAMRKGLTAPAVLVLAALAMLAACAGTPSRPLAASAAAPVAQSQSQPQARPGDPERRNRQFQQAQALYLSGHMKEAAASFEELTRAYPSDAHVWLKYGNTLTRLGSYDGAATAFQTAVNLDPAQGGAAINLSLVRLAQAQAALDVALTRVGSESPEHAQADGLQRQIKKLLGASDTGPQAH